MFLYEFCIKLLKQYLLGGPQRAASESLSGPDNFPTRGKSILVSLTSFNLKK